MQRKVSPTFSFQTPRNAIPPKKKEVLWCWPMLSSSLSMLWYLPCYGVYLCYGVIKFVHVIVFARVIMFPCVMVLARLLLWCETMFV